MSVCLTREKRKARKQHRCYLCGFQIHSGEVYDYASGVEPGEGYWTAKTHQHCLSKTADWYDEEWEVHDYGEFRRWDLAPEVRAFRELLEVPE